MIVGEMVAAGKKKSRSPALIGAFPLPLGSPRCTPNNQQASAPLLGLLLGTNTGSYRTYWVGNHPHRIG